MSLKKLLNNDNSTQEETLIKNENDSINDNSPDIEGSENEEIQTDKELSKNLETRRWFIFLMFFLYS